MKPTIDQLGEQARKLREELQGASEAIIGARDEVKGYNAERKEKTAKLCEILTPIVKELEAGGTVNGIAGLQKWAWFYNPTTKSPKNSLRQIMRIVKPKDEGEDKVTSCHSKVTKLKEDMVVSLQVYLGNEEKKHTVNFRVLYLPEGDGDFYGTKKDRRKRFASVTLERVEEEKPTAPKKVKKVSSQMTTSTPEIVEVVKRQKERIALGLHPSNSGCPDNETTDLRRHFPTDEDRQSRELLNDCGNLDGDENEEAL